MGVACSCGKNEGLGVRPALSSFALYYSVCDLGQFTDVSGPAYSSAVLGFCVYVKVCVVTCAVPHIL